MSLEIGKYKTRYLPDASQVVIEMDYYDIIGESEEFIAIFKRGRSVYLSGVGSVYEPAKIYFGKFTSDREPVVETANIQRESWVDIQILLECPIRGN